jgi:hypothetical protein
MPLVQAKAAALASARLLGLDIVRRDHAHLCGRANLLLVRANRDGERRGWRDLSRPRGTAQLRGRDKSHIVRLKRG